MVSGTRPSPELPWVSELFTVSFKKSNNRLIYDFPCVVLEGETAHLGR